MRVDPKQDPTKFFISNLLSGGAAGATSLAFSYPLDFVRVRMAADVGSELSGSIRPREFTGFENCLITIYEKDGPLGLYRGCGTSVGGVIAYRAAYFGLFDTGKSILRPPNIL